MQIPLLHRMHLPQCLGMNEPSYVLKNFFCFFKVRYTLRINLCHLELTIRNIYRAVGMIEPFVITDA